MVLAVIFSGCNRSDIQVYEVAKEKEKTAAQPGTMPPGHPPVSNTPSFLKWSLPEGWEETAPGQIRVASFVVRGQDGKSADVSIIPLPGQAGSDLDNVNRWRGQVSLPPITDEELAKMAEPLEITGQPAQLYDMAGVNPGSEEKSRILAALMRREGIAWFFKMTGDDALVAQQKPVFIDFLKSLTFTTAPQAELPPSHPPIGDALTAAQSSAPPAWDKNKPTWQVPSGWKETPGGQFLVAKFLLNGADNAQAAVNVSMSVGDGGGLAGNVNRWRKQLGLNELPEAEINQQLTSVEVLGGKAFLVDLAGTEAQTGQKARLMGAVVPRSGQTWFYKLMGNEQVVEREKEAFIQFLQTAKYPN